MKTFEITREQISAIHNARYYLLCENMEKALSLLGPVAAALMEKADEYQEQLDQKTRQLGEQRGIKATVWSVQMVDLEGPSIVPFGGYVVSPYSRERETTQGPSWLDTWAAIDRLAQREDWGDHIFIERVSVDGLISLGS